MSDFLDEEAQESDDEEELNEAERRKLKRIRDETDDEEDDEEQYADELKDFIEDANVEESDSDAESEVGESRKRKKRSDDEAELDDQLEDDDYDLLEENLGIKVQRKKFRRVQLEEDSDEEREPGEETSQDAEGSDEETGKEGEDGEHGGEREEQGARSEESDEDEELRNFIVDEDGNPITAKSKKKRRHHFPDSALQDAQDIFGVDFDYEEVDQIGEQDEEEEDEDDDEDAYSNEEDEDEEGARKKRARGKKARKGHAQKQSIFEIYEPAELERGHWTDKDNKVRTTDIPERLQLRAVPVTGTNPVEGEEDKEIFDEAEWIYRNAFATPSISDQNFIFDPVVPDPEPPEKNGEENSEEPPPDPFKGDPTIYYDEYNVRYRRIPKPTDPAAVPKIRSVLNSMRNDLYEVPFIANYRKEMICPELTNVELWKICKFDEKWCQLKSRKENLARLVENMMDYQQDLVLANPDSPLPDDMKVLTHEDVYKIYNVESVEEFQDVYAHFLLYFHHHLQPMQEFKRKKKKEEIEIKKREREARRLARLLRRRTKFVKVTKTVTDEETGEEKEIEVEEEVENSDEEPLDEPDDEPIEDEEEELEAQAKLPVRRDPYNICKRAGLLPFADFYGLSAEHFGENVREEYLKNEVKSHPVEPLEAAKEFICPQFPKPEEVLNAAHYMMANQLASEPAVRKAAREKMYERATVTIRPTKKGFKEIDENHFLYMFKYITEKPVRSFRHDEFLKVVMGEEDHLITVEINTNIPGNGLSSYVDEMKQWFYKDEFSSLVESWNKAREKVIELMFEQFLWPLFRKEIKRKLTTEAKEAVIFKCAMKLRDQIKVKPYEVEENDAIDEDEDWDTSNGIRVMGVAYANDMALAAFACLIDVDGEVSDILRLPSLLKRMNSFRPGEKEAKERDLQSIKDFIRKRKPHVVIIGAESREALMIQRDIQDVIYAIDEEDKLPIKIKVHFGDNNLAKIYSNSIKGQNDFKDYPDILRQAISMARRLQDPLLEFAQLCTMDEELLCINFHPLQDNVSKEELLEALYQEMINVVNDVGVDINRCATNPYMGNVLQFVGGLGPRKAAGILKLMRQKSIRIENRGQLVTNLHLGPKVFSNCAGFLKIDTTIMGDSGENYVEVLDSTRIHPECYEFARKMAIDALEYDELGLDANPAAALDEVLESPERLKDLDLDAFAEELAKTYGPKHIILLDIRDELNSRYYDRREPWVPPTDDDLFEWFTKETPDTFYCGRMVLATVIGFFFKKTAEENPQPERRENGLWECPLCRRADFPELSEVWNHFDAKLCPGTATGVKIRLENGLMGKISLEDLSDAKIQNPEERVKIGQVIHCRVKAIDVERLFVLCMSKTSALHFTSEDAAIQNLRPRKDQYFDEELEIEEIKKDSEQKNALLKKKNAYMSRVIVHPNFYNIDYAGAEAKMAHMQQGDVIIRPSSQGVDHLTVTWKVAEGVHQHIDVKEKQKENAFSLGKSLWINGEEYEDLDEIVARCVNPMASHARDILNYKYYRDTKGGNRDVAEEVLREEKRKAPNKIPYIVSVVAAKEMPGKFMLSYMPRLKAHHEYITVTPEGFRYRRQMFESFNVLLRWFKEHHREPIPHTPGGQSTVNTNRTPGGFSVASVSRDQIRQAARTLPGSLYNTLSQVVPGSQTPHTPHYPHTPHTPFTHYTQTPYTPSGQTPFMTPYSNTPRQPGQPQAPPPSQHHSGPSQGGRQPVTPNYGAQNWNTAQRSNTGSSNAGAPSRSNYPGSSKTPNNQMDQWRQAAEAWVKQTSKNTSNRVPRTPGYEDARRTPQERRTPRGGPGNSNSYADGTPLYDE